jgi:hypothetical protein
MVGGDPERGFPLQGIWVDDAREHFPDTNIFDDADMGSEYRENLDPYHNIQQQLFDTFDLSFRLREETPYIFKDDVEEDEMDDDIEQDMESLDDLYREGTQPIYAIIDVNTISACIVLINMVVIHNVSNAYVDELFRYLSTVLLGNRLPKNHYKAKKLIRKLGLNYDIIHTCPKGCVLYCGEYE